LIASAKVRNKKSTSESGCDEPPPFTPLAAFNDECNLLGGGIPLDFPGVGIPKIRGLPGVIDIKPFTGIVISIGGDQKRRIYDSETV
jgi:hypothetical protein